jgi:hypothetical protein
MTLPYSTFPANQTHFLISYPVSWWLMMGKKTTRILSCCLQSESTILPVNAPQEKHPYHWLQKYTEEFSDYITITCQQGIPDEMRCFTRSNNTFGGLV